MVESWAEHLRQHRRVSKADADIRARVLAFHIGPDKPVVHHFLALDMAHAVLPQQTREPHEPRDHAYAGG